MKGYLFSGGISLIVVSEPCSHGYQDLDIDLLSYVVEKSADLSMDDFGKSDRRQCRWISTNIT